MKFYKALIGMFLVLAGASIALTKLLIAIDCHDSGRFEPAVVQACLNGPHPHIFTFVISVAAASVGIMILAAVDKI